MFLRNVGMYRRVYTAPKPRTTSSSCPVLKLYQPFLLRSMFSSDFYIRYEFRMCYVRINFPSYSRLKIYVINTDSEQKLHEVEI
jgi:hypothetical protein